ncbi:MAG: twin-arginine translocase subunit TatC [Planctomycetota bacterium]
MSTEGEAENENENGTEDEYGHDYGTYEEYQDMIGEAVMPLGDHLEELRSRVIKSMAAVAVAFIGCWVFRDTIMEIVKRPHELATIAAEVESSLKFQGYTEPIIAQLKACLIAAAVITGPWIVYQAWAFVAPGLYPKERHKALKMVMPSVVCLMAGVSFGYFFAIPMALRFLLRMAGPNTEPVLMIGAYLSLFFLLTLALGVAFQTPVIIFYLVRWNIVQPSTLQENRKIAILVAFVLSAFFTPPDFITQSMMAIPLVLLYDLGVVAGYPSRETALNFGKFAGLLLLGGALLAGWFYYWPIGRLVAVKGEVTVSESVVKQDQSSRVVRGQVCRVGEDGGARLMLDSGKNAPRVLMRGGSRVQVHSSSRLTLLEGKVLAIQPREESELQLRNAIAKGTLKNGTAEFVAAPDDYLKITVYEGSVTATHGKKEPVTIRAGETKTFRRGGEPARQQDLDEGWRELMGGGEEGAEKKDEDAEKKEASSSGSAEDGQDGQ